jgi:branched-subunit amino acid aminotransferase/4-amino-4-deoxychorismate lyase
MAVCEGTFSPAALAEAGMIFLTSGARGLAPVTKVLDETGRVLVEPATADHPWYRRLEERFRTACMTETTP